MNKCPTCGAPAKMTWSGLDLVAESGDETLASKHYEYKPNGNNMVLAVSGLTPNYLREIEERIIWRLQTEFKDKTDLVQQIVADNFEHLHNRLAACANGAVDTVAEGGEVCRCGNPSGMGNVQFEGDELIYMCADCGKRAESPAEEQP